MSGAASVKSKNVCLQLVDEHIDLHNHGVVQMFTQPHPGHHLPLAYNTMFPPSIARQPQHIYQISILKYRKLRSEWKYVDFSNDICIRLVNIKMEFYMLLLTTD